MKIFLSCILLVVGINLFAQDNLTILHEEKRLLRDIQMNSVQVEYRLTVLSAYYERLIPLGNKFGLALIGGISQGVVFNFDFDELYLTGKIDLIFGGTRHFFESGVWLSTAPEVMRGPLFLIGYRFLSTSGFLLKFDTGIFFDSVGPKPIPALTIGYSF